MIRKTYITIILICILAGFAGCGQQRDVSREIELLEPVSAGVTAEAAAYRSLYDADVYTTSVLPYIEEYAFTVNGEVEEFTVLPGAKVKEGEVLAFCNTEDIDEDIEALEEDIAAMEEEYLEYKQDMEEVLAEDRGEASLLGEIVDDLKGCEPDQFIPGEDGAQKENPEHEKWSKEYLTYEGKYLKQSHSVTMQEAALRQKTELYELDHAYYLEKLKDLKAERGNYILRSQMDGEVVAVGQTGYETFGVQADRPVIAVGDTSRKILKCNYIQKNIVTGAEEVYALIDGEKYELEYQPMDAREYIRLTQSGETVYSTFEIKAAGDDIRVGASAAVVIVKNKQENVLTVPEDAVHSEAAVRYVYVVENGQGVRRNVKVGMSDGVYTEILSGLAEGELVKVKDTLSAGAGEAVLQKGTYSSIFMQSGYMYYPSITEVENPITYGTAYHAETHAALYQYVEKDRVIATIRVESDAIELQRDKLKLQRLQERLQDLVAEGDPEGNADAIADKQEEIAELNSLLADKQQDAEVTEIKAPAAGIIVQLEYFGTDEKLKAGSTIARIADAGSCYVMVKNLNQQLHYGQEVTITYKNAEDKECTVTGRVASAAQIGVSEALQGEESFVLVPPESSKDMIVINAEKDNKWENARYQVTADVKAVNQVVLVPNDAVTEVSGCTYVHIVDENGRAKAQSFIAGGHDNTHYWVIEGLTEGMKVCLE